MKLVLIIIYLLLFSVQTKAQNPQWMVFDTSNTSLLTDVVFDIDIDSDNVKWFANLKGLTRFDNSNWQTFHSTNSTIPFDTIYRVESSPNRIWIINPESNKGLAGFDGTNWEIFDSTNAPFYNNLISAIKYDPFKDELWVGAHYGQVLRYDGVNWNSFDNVYDSQWGYSIRDLCIDDDTVWMASDGIRKFADSTNWEWIHTLNSVLPSITVQKITNENGIKWFATWNGLAKLEDTSWTIYNTSNSILPTNALFSMNIDQNSNKWIGTYNSGLVKFDDITMTIFNSVNSPLPDDRINDIEVDANNNIWIATNYGVAVYNENGIVLSNEKNSIHENRIEIFPNPASENFTINIANNNSATWNFEILNLTGQVLYKSNDLSEKQFQFQSKDMKSGIYLIKIVSENNISIQKIIFK